MEILHYSSEIQNIIDNKYKTSCSGKEYTINHPETLVLNTVYVSKGSKTPHNSQGWERDNNKYFKELLEEHPEYFSNTNKTLILNNKAPIVNDKFISYFPQYSAYKKQKLVLHHIGGDGQIVAIPQDVHYGFGEIHNIERDLGIRDIALDFSNYIETQVESGNAKIGQKVEYYKSFSDQNSQEKIDELNKKNNDYKSNKKETKLNISDSSKVSIKDKLLNGLVATVNKAIDFSEKHPIATDIVVNGAKAVGSAFVSIAMDNVFNKSNDNCENNNSKNPVDNNINKTNTIDNNVDLTSETKTYTPNYVPPGEQRYHTKEGIKLLPRVGYPRVGHKNDSE